MDVEEYGLAYIVMGNLHKLRQQRFIRILETDALTFGVVVLRKDR